MIWGYLQLLKIKATSNRQAWLSQPNKLAPDQRIKHLLLVLLKHFVTKLFFLMKTAFSSQDQKVKVWEAFQVCERPGCLGTGMQITYSVWRRKKWFWPSGFTTISNLWRGSFKWWISKRPLINLYSWDSSNTEPSLYHLTAHLLVLIIQLRANKPDG